MKVGALHAGNEKVGTIYTKDNGKLSKITYADTLGGYVQLGTNMFQHMYIYGTGIYRGLVAETNPAMVRGSFFTAEPATDSKLRLELM